jgi:hypothetical protein
MKAGREASPGSRPALAMSPGAAQKKVGWTTTGLLTLGCGMRG